MTSMAIEDLDPQPGDFDEELAAIDPKNVQFVEHPKATGVSIQVTVRGDDANRLDRLARDRGQRPGEVVADLLRDADPGAA